MESTKNTQRKSPLCHDLFVGQILPYFLKSLFRKMATPPMNESKTTDPGAAYARSSASTSCGENCPRHGERLLRDLASMLSADAGSGELKAVGPAASLPGPKRCGCALAWATSSVRSIMGLSWRSNVRAQPQALAFRRLSAAARSYAPYTTWLSRDTKLTTKALQLTA